LKTPHKVRFFSRAANPVRAGHKKSRFSSPVFSSPYIFSVRFRHLRPLLWDRFRNTGGDKKTQTKKMTDPILILIGRFFSL